jgi:integrase
VKNGQRDRIGPPKSKAGRRTVPLSGRVAAELRPRRAEAEWHRADDLVFPSGAGTVMLDANLRRRVLQPAARAAGVPWCSFHALRHTAATLMFGQGRNVKQVQYWLGHSDPSLTLRPTSACSMATSEGRSTSTP